MYPLCRPGVNSSKAFLKAGILLIYLGILLELCILNAPLNELSSQPFQLNSFINISFQNSSHLNYFRILAKRICRPACTFLFAG